MSNQRNNFCSCNLPPTQEKCPLHGSVRMRKRPRIISTRRDLPSTSKCSKAEITPDLDLNELYGGTIKVEEIDEMPRLEICPPSPSKQETTVISISCAQCRVLNEHVSIAEKNVDHLQDLIARKNFEIDNLKAELTQREELCDSLIIHNENLQQKVIDAEDIAEKARQASREAITLSKKNWFKTNNSQPPKWEPLIRTPFPEPIEEREDVTEKERRATQEAITFSQMNWYKTNNSQLVDEVNALRRQNAELRAKVDTLQKELSELLPPIRTPFSQLSEQRKRVAVIVRTLDKMLGGSGEVREFAVFLSVWRERNPEYFHGCELVGRLSESEDIQLCQLAKITKRQRLTVKRYLTSKRLDIFAPSKRVMKLKRILVASGEIEFFGGDDEEDDDEDAMPELIPMRPLRRKSLREG